MCIFWSEPLDLAKVDLTHFIQIHSGRHVDTGLPILSEAVILVWMLFQTSTTRTTSSRIASISKAGQINGKMPKVHAVSERLLA